MITSRQCWPSYTKDIKELCQTGEIKREEGNGWSEGNVLSITVQNEKWTNQQQGCEVVYAIRRYTTYIH